MNESKPHDQNRRLTQVVRAWFGHGSGKHFSVRAGRFGSGMVRAWFGQPLSGSGREAVRAWFGHGSGRPLSVRAGPYGSGMVRAWFGQAVFGSGRVRQGAGSTARPFHHGSALLLFFVWRFFYIELQCVVQKCSILLES